MLFLLQFIGIVIPGNQKITLEGNNYGLYMFEANHQCVSTYTIVEISGNKNTRVTSNADARNRCDPYLYLKALQKKCQTHNISKVSWKFDHSINGEPLYRIVDEENICSIEYKPLTHNSWINIDTPPYISEVNKNIFDLSRTNLEQDIFKKNFNGRIYSGNKSIENNKPYAKTNIQKKISPFTNHIYFAYWLIWWGILMRIIFLLFFKRKN
jgi:hypothetical protein